MTISYETTQQFLTYLIEFFGFVALFILPSEYIIKCNVDEIRSWGIPREGHSGMPNPAHTFFKNQAEKEITLIKQRTSESKKSTITKTKMIKKTELLTA